jgi:cell division protein FtsL
MIYNFIIAIIILIASSLFFIQPKMYDIVNGQTIEDERIENTLEKIKEGTQGISDRTNSSDNIPKSTNSNTTSDGSNLQYNKIEYKI